MPRSCENNVCWSQTCCTSYVRAACRFFPVAFRPCCVNLHFTVVLLFVDVDDRPGHDECFVFFCFGFCFIPENVFIWAALSLLTIDSALLREGDVIVCEWVVQAQRMCCPVIDQFPSTRRIYRKCEGTETMFCYRQQPTPQKKKKKCRGWDRKGYLLSG